MEMSVSEVQVKPSSNKGVAANAEGPTIGGLAGVFAALLAGFQSQRQSLPGDTAEVVDTGESAVGPTDDVAETERDVETVEGAVETEIDVENVEEPATIVAVEDTELVLAAAATLLLVEESSGPPTKTASVAVPAAEVKAVTAPVVPESVVESEPTVAVAKLIAAAETELALLGKEQPVKSPSAGSVQANPKPIFTGNAETLSQVAFARESLARAMPVVSAVPAEVDPAIPETESNRSAGLKISGMSTEVVAGEEVPASKGLLEVIKPPAPLEAFVQGAVRGVSESVTERTAQLVKASPEMPAAPTATIRNVGEVTIRSIRHLIGSKTESIQIRLVPRSLGELNISVTVRDGSLDVVVSSASSMVREVIEEQLVSLRDSLSKEGVELSSLKVDSAQKFDMGSLLSQSQGRSQEGRAMASRSQQTDGYPKQSDQSDTGSDRKYEGSRERAHDGDLNVYA